MICGVESGVFPINFALQVAYSTDSQIQHVLMDAFDEGIVSTNNFSQARKIITARSRDKKQNKQPKTYTVAELEKDIKDATDDAHSYVRESKTKENRFMTLLDQIDTLWQDSEFVDMLRQESLVDRPDLAGDFTYESMTK